MATQHQHEFGLELALGGSACGEEIVVHVKFSYTPGEAPTGPSFSSAGDPGSPPETEVGEITLRDENGGLLFCPAWLMARIEAAIDHDVLAEIGAEEDE